jgi:hypothetical protein
VGAVGATHGISYPIQLPESLGVPIMASLPVQRRSGLSRYATCPVNHQPASLQVQCMYASGRNMSVGLHCNRTQRRLAYQCPLLPRCTSWDVEGRYRGWHGCTSLPMESTASGLRCAINRLGTFSAVTDAVQQVAIALEERSSWIATKDTDANLSAVFVGKAQSGG